MPSFLEKLFGPIPEPTAGPNDNSALNSIRTPLQEEISKRQGEINQARDLRYTQLEQEINDLFQKQELYNAEFDKKILPHIINFWTNNVSESTVLLLDEAWQRINHQRGHNTRRGLDFQYDPKKANPRLKISISGTDLTRFIDTFFYFVPALNRDESYPKLLHNTREMYKDSSQKRTIEELNYDLSRYEKIKTTFEKNGFDGLDINYDIYCWYEDSYHDEYGSGRSTYSLNFKLDKNGNSSIVFGLEKNPDTRPIIALEKNREFENLLEIFSRHFAQ